MEELREKLKQEYGYRGKPKQWQLGFDSALKEITRPTPEAIKDIVWTGKCEHCEGLGYHEEMYTCHKCNGKGTITRPATLEEVAEWTTKKLTLMYQGHTEVTVTINGGALSIKQKEDSA